MGEIRKVRIRNIDGPYRVADEAISLKKNKVGFYKKNYSQYNWEELRESFDKYGYDTDKFGYITVVGCNTCENKDKYVLRDGNHRLYILREMFGDEHFVSVNLVRAYTVPFKLKCGWCDRVKELSKKTSGKLELTNVIVMSTCFLVLYIKPTLMFMGVLLGIIILSVTGIFDIKKETYNKHSLKFGGTAGKFINIVKNIPIITMVIASIYYIWYLITMNIYYFMLIVGFTLIMGYLIGYYEKKEENDWKEGGK